MFLSDYLGFASNILVSKEFSEFFDKRYNERPHCFANDLIEELEEMQTYKSSNEKVVSLDEETIVVSGYNKASDKVAYVLEIVDNNTLDTSEKIKKIDWCLHNLFFELSGFPHRYHFENWNWNAIERIISIREELLETLSEDQYGSMSAGKSSRVKQSKKLSSENAVRSWASALRSEMCLWT